MSMSDCSINHAPSVKLSTMGHIGERITFLKYICVVPQKEVIYQGQARFCPCIYPCMDK